MTLSTVSSDVGAGDVVLSSIGFVCVTASKGTVQMKAFTPGGKGLICRTSSLLSFSTSVRGKRIAGTF